MFAPRILSFLALSLGSLISAKISAGDLEDFLLESIKTSTSYVEAEQNLVLAHSTYETYRSALLPTLAAQWNHSKTNRSDGFDSLLALNAKQTLFGGGSEYTELKAASLMRLKSEADLRDTKALILSRSLLQALRWQFQKRRLEVLNQVKKTQEGRIQELVRRVRLGQSREPDLLQAQVENSSIERQILNTEGQRDQIEESLRGLLELDESKFSQLVSLIERNTPLEHLQNKRPPLEDYRTESLELSLKALQFQETSAWLKSMPTLGAYAQKNLVRPSPSANEWELGLQAEWTFFEGLRTPAEINAAKALRLVNEKKLFALRYEQKINSERVLRDQARLDLKIASVTRDLDRARRALRQQEKDYRLGLVTELEVQQTLQSLLNLELEGIDLEGDQASLILQAHLKGDVIL